jgi:hypothetical protein
MNLGRFFRLGRGWGFRFDFGRFRLWRLGSMGDVGCRPQPYLRGRGIVFDFAALAAPAPKRQQAQGDMQRQG